MSDIPSNHGPTGCERCNAMAQTFAFLLLRFWLAVRAIATGLDKYAGRTTVQQPLLDEFGNPDINGTMVAVEKKVYGLSHYQGLPTQLKLKFAAEPLMPDWLLGPYAKMLGPALIILGVTLLLGIGTRASLFLMGLLYVSLSLGLILIREDAGVAWLGIHVLMVVAALLLARHNRLSLMKRF